METKNNRTKEVGKWHTLFTQNAFNTTENIFLKIVQQCLNDACKGEYKGSEVFSFNSSLVNYSKKPITASIQASGRKAILITSSNTKEI